MRKSKRTKYLEQKKKEYAAICRSLGIKRTITKYGLCKVVCAMSKFVTTERERAKLQREAKSLKVRLTEIEKKTA